MNEFGSTAGTLFGGTAGTTFPAIIGSGFPNVNVKDSKTKSDVPIAGGIGWDDDFIQAQKVIDFPLVFTNITSISVGVEISSIYVKRKSKFLIGLIISDSSAAVEVVPVYYDTNGVRTIGESKAPTTIIANPVNGFDCNLLILDTLGSAKMSFIINSLSSGTILSANITAV